MTYLLRGGNRERRECQTFSVLGTGSNHESRILYLLFRYVSQKEDKSTFLEKEIKDKITFIRKLINFFLFKKSNLLRKPMAAWWCGSSHREPA
jgi:hypothetical protein